VFSQKKYQGIMAGYDQKSNVVLSDSKERVYSTEDGVEEIPLGLYLVKGDQMYDLSPACTSHLYQETYSHSVLIGEIDQAIDESADLSSIRAEPLPAIHY
jgi:U6 snRNA-associated Sm-like protein LSm8